MSLMCVLKPGSAARSPVELCSASTKPSAFLPTPLQTFAGQVLSCSFLPYRIPVAILFPFVWASGEQQV